ncbi:uridine kinase [Streptomyces rimosus]|uniref:uridine kinase n=1 Tax=Streptomyces rimosus TaxID=1927 RepID=UPI003791FD1D
MLLTLTGGSGAGKTTLAAALAATAPGDSVRVLHADDYYFRTPDSGVWFLDENGVPHLDFGDPRSLDLAGLALDTEAALASHAVAIVDGLFACRVVPQVACARFHVFVDLPADLRLVRKIQRKCLRDGFPLDVLLHNYLRHRRDAHDRHVEPARHDCDLELDGTLPAETLARQVWSVVLARGLTGVRQSY